MNDNCGIGPVGLGNSLIVAIQELEQNMKCKNFVTLFNLNICVICVICVI